jgi:hypothetical protein
MSEDVFSSFLFPVVNTDVVVHNTTVIYTGEAMNKKGSVFSIRGHEFHWLKQRTLNLCADCEFHLPGQFADCCEASTDRFDCKEERYGAWQEIGLGK